MNGAKRKFVSQEIELYTGNVENELIQQERVASKFVQFFSELE